MSAHNGNGATATPEELKPFEDRIVHASDEVAVATKTVALVGTASSSRDLVNEQGTDVEVWGLNASYSWMPRWDRWFEVHSRQRYDHIAGDHLKKLQEMTCPVYMAEAYDDIPAAVQFPLVDVLQGRFRPLFTSSVAYMLALAVYEGFEEIRLCGIDMALDSEYAYQRAACEYWIGVAEALGRRVVIPASSPIGKAPLYGVEAPAAARMVTDWKERVNNQRVTEYEEFFTEVFHKFDEFRMKVAAVEGMRQIIAQMQQKDA